MSSSKQKVLAGKKGAGKVSKEKALNPNNTFLRRNKLHIWLFCLVFVVFGNSIFNQYALDDEFYTNGSNPLTQKGFKGIPEIFKSRTFFNNDGSGYSYRPVAVTSFAIEIQLFGEHAQTSHFINVLLYAFTIVLLFTLLRKWFHTQGDWFSFLICLLFLVHPLHTEVVANIKCRDELLAFFFSVITLHMVWMHYETRKWWTLVLAGLSFGAAMLSKNSAISVILLAPLSTWYFSNEKGWKNLVYILPLVGTMVLIKLGLSSNLKEMSRTFQGFENPIADMSGGQLTATAAYVMGRYLWLHIIPHPLIFYYGLNEVPVCSWSDPLVILSALVFVALGVFTLMELRKKTIAGFGLFWFMGNLAMFSNLFGAAPGLMAERFAYSASLGFAIAAVDLIFRYMKYEPTAFSWKSVAAKNVRMIFLTVVVLFSLRSIIRNEAWQDKETLYRNDVAIAPESAKINMLLGSYLSSQGARCGVEASQHYNYAQQYMMRGMQQQAAIQQDSAKQLRAKAQELFRESREYYEQAVRIFPTYYTAWSNLGTSYYFTKEYRGGVPYFQKAIEIKKDYAEGYFNLGMTYEQLAMAEGKVVDTMLLDSSVFWFSQGLIADPKYVASGEQLGRIYYQHYGDSVGAIRLLEKVAADNPKSAGPWNAMSNIYLQSHDTVTAVAKLEKAAELDPDNFERLRNLAGYFARHGNSEKAAYYSALATEKEAAYARRQKMIDK